MRASQVIRDFLEWRWTPCVALTAASLAWVGLAVLFIPNRLGSNEPPNSGASTFSEVPVLPNTAFNSALTQSAFTSTQPIRRVAPPPIATANEPVIRKGFSPPIEQPAAPPPPPPAPVTQAAPPPPVPSPPVNVAPPTPPAEPTPAAAPAAVPAAAPAPPAPAEDGSQGTPAPQ